MLRKLGLWIEREIYIKASTGDRHENVVIIYYPATSNERSAQGLQLHILPMLRVHMRYSQPIRETCPHESVLGLIDHSMECITVISATAILRISF